MILGFRVSNYRSFRTETQLSMTGTRLDKDVGIDVAVAEDGATIRVLPVIAILGANASGKSNLLRALSYMRDTVVYSASRAPFEELERDPFRFDKTAAKEPSHFEIDFSLNGTRYVYGFEVDDESFADEWMFAYPHKRAQTVFERERGDFQFGKRLSGSKIRTVAEITRPSSLFLSSAAQAGHPELSRIYEYFVNNIQFLDVPARTNADSRMVERVRSRKNKAIELLAMADLGIQDARVAKSELADSQKAMYRRMILSSLPEDMAEAEREEHVQLALESLAISEDMVELIHQAGTSGVPLPFEEESLGTKSWLNFVTSALDVLESGGTLLVDELDASLHPLLMLEAINMFQSPGANTHGAQLIFTTHDTTLLGRMHEYLPLSRGQFWFAEKDARGRSSLTALSDFRPRKGEDLERGYLQGRYGGTPRLLRRTSSTREILESNRG